MNQKWLMNLWQLLMKKYRVIPTSFLVLFLRSWAKIFQVSSGILQIFHVDEVLEPIENWDHWKNFQ